MAPPPAWPEHNPGGTMRIDVGGSELDARPELRAHAEQRLRSTLSRFACYLDSIAVRGETVDMRPLKGAFGCRIVARLRGGRELVEEVVANDLCTAIDGAVEALEDSVESCLPGWTDDCARAPG